MSEPKLFPLEKVLKAKAENLEEVPDHRDDLFSRYLALLNYLRLKIYPFVDAGLAALSEENGIYTLHNGDHFDEVVKYAGELLGCRKGDEVFDLLNTYELFVLLVAIRIHDAGNMDGRERHERRTYQILKEAGETAILDNTERTFISDIAKAHGGKVDDGTPEKNKDTIGLTLSEEDSYGNVDFHPRRIAAIVRFADEICESRPRAAQMLLAHDKIDKKNEVFHKYASSISSVRVPPVDNRLNKPSSPIDIRLKFEVSREDCLRKWGKIEDNGIKNVFLLDEIFFRLEKMILERRYCNQYMRDVCNVVGLTAKIKIYEEIDDLGIQVPHTIKEILIIEKAGYPKSNHFLSDMYKINGEKLKQELE